jgi:phosphoribosylformylglycinamidine cyclo-ligase
MKGSIYAAQGVSSSKGDVHAAIARHDKGLFPGAFCKILPDYFTGDSEHCIIAHADGAGTKAALAYVAWREGLGLRVWRGIAQDGLVMNFDDVGCVGARGPFVASNSLGRNAFLITGDVIAALIDGAQEFCDEMTGLGIPCHVGGGETADIGDLDRTVTVDSTVVCRMERNKVIDASRMVPGDLIVGFSSTGQASWEKTSNSGIGSNGLTNARHSLLSGVYATRYPETFSPQMPSELVYYGNYQLTDPLPGGEGFTIGSALLSPTRTYLPLVKALLQGIPFGTIHGLIHCSGGGQTKIGNSGAPYNRYVKDNLFPVPPLFALIQSAGMTWEEMHAVYNMGHRLEAVVSGDERAQQCIDIAKFYNIEAKVVGHVERGDKLDREVVIRTPNGEFIY